MTSRDYENEEIFVRPLCLINSTKEGKFYTEEDVLRQIQKIDVPLVVVAVVGLYRTGKSYLMNRLAGVSQGFPLGSSVESKTKGIWAWCHKHPEFPDTVLLLLDTEGLGDVAKGDQGHDNRIFTLATLLCNVLVYNVMTAFNQDAVEKLTFISELSKNIHFANKSDTCEQNDQLQLILPTFVLCIRDFTLTLEFQGKEITADEYLEECVKLKEDKGHDMERYNRPRRSLRKYFPTRKCFTFEAPGTKQTIRRLNELRLEDLSEEFIEETKQFLAYIYQRQPKVLLTSKPVTGQMFVPLVETYVKAISEGAVPDVDDAILTVARIENERMAQEAVATFKKCLLDVRLPVLQALEFDNLRQELQSKCLSQFRLESVFDEDGKYEKGARVEMDRLWKEIKANNLKLLEQHCGTELISIYEQYVAEKKLNRVYFVKGGYNAYKNDIAKVKSQYKRELKGVDEVVAMAVLNSFMEEEGQTETEILMLDQQYSEEERKKETEKLHREHLEAQKQQNDMFERRIKEEAERAEKHMEKLDEQRRENSRQNEEKLKQLTDIWAKEKEFYNMQIKEIEAKNAEEREAHRKTMVELQNSITKQRDEAEKRIQEERAESKRKTDALESGLNRLTDTLAKQNEARELQEKKWRQQLAEQDSARRAQAEKNEKLAKRLIELEEYKNRPWYKKIFS